MDKINEERREKILRIFKNLFRNSLDRIENVNKKKLYEDDRDIHEILIEEVCKPQFCNDSISIETDRSNGNSINCNNKRIVITRNSDKICYLLKNITGFQRFMKFNQISDENIMKATQFLQYEKVPQYNYIFRQGENPKSFYIILKGSISIRKRKFKTNEEVSVEINSNQKPKEDSANRNTVEKEKEKVEKNNISSEKLLASPIKNDNKLDTINYSPDIKPILNNNNNKNNILNDLIKINEKNSIKNYNRNNLIGNLAHSDKFSNGPNMRLKKSAFKMPFRESEINNTKKNLVGLNFQNKIISEINEISEKKSLEDQIEEDLIGFNLNKNESDKNNPNDKILSPIIEQPIKELILPKTSRFNWRLLFQDVMQLDLELHKIKNQDGSLDKREKGKFSKSKDSKTDLNNLLMKSRTLVNQASLAGPNNNYRKIITSDYNSAKLIKEFEMEDEIVKLNDGQCFGEWGLMFNLPRAASAFTMEETHLLFLDKDFFKFCFNKNMHRSIAEKKNFFIKRLPFLRGSTKIEEFLKNLNPIYYSHGEVIYTERDEASDVYLIFQGEAILQRFIQRQSYSTSKEVIENKDKLRTILKVDRGGVVGLEAFTGEKFYKNNFISYGYTVVFKLPLKIFSYKENFIIKNFLELYKKQQFIMETIHAGLVSLNENTEFKREKPEGVCTNYERKLIERGASLKNVNLILQEIKNKKKKYENEFDNFNYLYTKKIEEDYFDKIKLQNNINDNNLNYNIHTNNNNNFDNNNYDNYTSAEDNYSPLGKFKKIKRHHMNNNSNLNNVSNDKSGNKKVKLIEDEDLPQEKLPNRSDNETDKNFINKTKEKKVRFKTAKYQTYQESKNEIRLNYTITEGETIDYDEHSNAIAKKAGLFSNIDLKSSLNLSIPQRYHSYNKPKEDFKNLEKTANGKKDNCENKTLKSYKSSEKAYEPIIYPLKLNLNLDKIIDFTKKADKKIQDTNNHNELVLKCDDKPSIFLKDEFEIANQIKKKEKENKEKEKGNKHKIKTQHDLFIEKDENMTKKLIEKKLKDNGIELDSNDNIKKSSKAVKQIKEQKEKSEIKNKSKEENNKITDKNNQIKDLSIISINQNYFENEKENKNNEKKIKNKKNKDEKYSKKLKSDKNLIITKLEQFDKNKIHKTKRSFSKLNLDISFKKDESNKMQKNLKTNETFNSQNKENDLIKENSIEKLNGFDEKVNPFELKKNKFKRYYTNVNLVKINLNYLTDESDNCCNGIKNLNLNENIANYSERVSNKNNNKANQFIEEQSFEFDEQKEFEKHKYLIKTNNEGKKKLTKKQTKKSQKSIVTINKNNNAEKNFKLLHEYKSLNNSYDNYINSPNNSNLKTNKNSNFSKIIYDFISPNHIFKEKSADNEKSLSGNSTNNLLLNSLNRYDLSGLGRNQNFEHLNKRVSLPLKNNFPLICLKNANDNKTDRSPILNKLNGVCEKNNIGNLKIINLKGINNSANLKECENKSFNPFNAIRTGEIKESLEFSSKPKFDSEYQQLILNDKFVNLTSHADVVFVNYAIEQSKIKTDNNYNKTNQENKFTSSESEVNNNNNNFHGLKNNLLQEKFQVEYKELNLNNNKIKFASDNNANNSKKYKSSKTYDKDSLQNNNNKNVDNYHNTINNFFLTNTKSENNIKNKFLAENNFYVSSNEIVKKGFAGLANNFLSNGQAQEPNISSAPLINNKTFKSNTNNKNINKKLLFELRNQQKFNQKQTFKIEENSNNHNNKDKYNNDFKIENNFNYFNNNFINENSNIYAKEKLEFINSLIAQDIEKLPELRENIIDFNEKREIISSPFCFQEEIDKVKIIIDNNKKEYTTNYKSFNKPSSSNLNSKYFKKIKSKQKNLFEENSKNKNAEKPIFNQNSGKLGNYSTCNNSAFEFNSANKKSSNLLHNKNLFVDAFFSDNKKEFLKDEKSKEKKKIFSKSRSDKKFIKSAFRLVSGEVEKTKYLMEYMRSRHKEIKSYLGKDFIKFSNKKSKKRTLSDKAKREEEDSKTKKIAAIFQSDFNSTQKNHEAHLFGFNNNIKQNENLIKNNQFGCNVSNNNFNGNLHEEDNNENENMQRFITNENNFSSQFNSSLNVLNFGNSKDNNFTFSQSKSILNKNSNKSLKVMVSCGVANRNAKESSLKNVQPLSKIMNQWVSSSHKISDFNTGTFSLPLLCDANKLYNDKNNI